MDRLVTRLCLWDAPAKRLCAALRSRTRNTNDCRPTGRDEAAFMPARGRTLGVTSGRWRSAARVGAGRDASALRDLWQGASVAAGWAHPGDWWCAEVDAVVESVARGAELSEPIARLA